MKELKSILQGILFNKNKKRYVENYSSLFEGNQNMGSTSSSNDNIATLKNNYNQKIQEWIDTYRDYVALEVNKDIDVSSLLNKVITLDEIDYYYVNNYGVKRKIILESDIETALTNHDCGSEDNVKEVNTNQFSKLITGTPLQYKTINGVKRYELCSDKYIQNPDRKVSKEGTTKIAWLDFCGNKHEFTDSTHHSTCGSSSDILPIKDTSYNLIKKSGTTTNPSKYSSSSECLRPSGNLEGKLNSLKEEATSIARQIMIEINTLKSQNGSTESTITSQADTLETETNSLNENRDKINLLKNEISSLEGSIQNNRINVGSINLRYMTWGVSFATIVILTMLVSKK